MKLDRKSVLKRPPAHALVADRIRASILEGGLPPGDQLRQDYLAKTYGVSQATIREAFRSLEAERLLESSPNRGMFVRQITPEGVAEVYALRECLETMALRRNFSNIDGKTLDKAEVLQKRSEKKYQFSFVSKENREFHALFYGTGQPSLTEDLINNCFGGITPSWMQFMRECTTAANEYEAESRHDHWELIRACQSNSLGEAEAVLSRHLRKACKVLANYLIAEAPDTKP